MNSCNKFSLKWNESVSHDFPTRPILNAYFKIFTKKYFFLYLFFQQAIISIQIEGVYAGTS